MQHLLLLFLLFFLGWGAYPFPLGAAQFLAVTTVPEDGILNPNPSLPDGVLNLYFSADQTGTVTISGPSFTPQTISYTTAPQTVAVTYPSSSFPVMNEFFSLSLRLTTSDSTQQAVTEVTIAVDATPPPPPSGVHILPANRAVLIYWDPQIPFPPPFNRNVESYILYYSGMPITDALHITQTTESGGLSLGYPDQNSPGTGVTAVTFLYNDHYFLEGLVNGQPVFLTLEAVDQAGNRSGILLDNNKKPVIYIGYPTETSTFSELVGIKDQCFIVTAASGNSESFLVQIYRMFRDRFLLELPFHRKILGLYYNSLGPRGAEWIRQHPPLRFFTFTLLLLFSPLVFLLALLTPAGALLLVPFCYWAGRRYARRKNSRAFFLLLASLLLAPPGTGSELWGAETFSLRVSPFFPSRVEGVAPNGQRIHYGDLYGRNGTFRFDLEYTFYPLEFLGQWGIGGSLGFATDPGKALALQSDGYVPSGEAARMNFLPAAGFLRYRTQYFSNQPLVLSLFGGGEFFGVQETRRTLANSIQTFAYGYVYGGEVELLLDLIDASAAAYMDYNYSIKDTTLFFGYTFHRLDNLGRKPTLDLTHRTWIAGLRFVY